AFLSAAKRALPTNPFTQKDPTQKKSGGTPTPIHNRLELRESRPRDKRDWRFQPLIHKKEKNHMSVAAQVVDPQSASLTLTLLQSKAGNRWARAVEEMKTNRLRVAGDFPEFIMTNKSGTAYKVKLDPHGSGSCTCPDFQVRIAQEGRICKHIAAAAITTWAPQSKASSSANGNGSVRAIETAAAEVSPLIFRIQRNVPTDGKNGTVVEVQARVTNGEVQDRETASYAYELLERLASLAGKNPAPPENKYAREAVSP